MKSRERETAYERPVNRERERERGREGERKRGRERERETVWVSECVCVRERTSVLQKTRVILINCPKEYIILIVHTVM